jgi:Domain of unknown function (DUF4123)
MAVQQFSEFVSTALANAAEPGLHRYLVVDTAATRPLNVANALAIDTGAIDILTGEPCVWRESASPVLVELPAVDVVPSVRRHVAETFAAWRYANCFTFIESLHARDVQVRMLRERCEAVLPQDMPVLLRYFDSRVFGVLMTVLSHDQRRSFLAAATRWATCGRRGELLCVEQGADASSNVAPLPIKLDTTQEATLIEAGSVDAMIDLLLSQNNAALQRLLPPEQHEQVSAALEAARNFGIERWADQVAFCALALDLGSTFHQLEPWATGLGEVHAGRLTFADLVSRAMQGEAA